jgi:hypothetical protein
MTAAWNRVLAFIDEGHLPMGGGYCGNLLERQGRELEISDPAELMRRRVNEKEPWRALMADAGLNGAHPACSALYRLIN